MRQDGDDERTGTAGTTHVEDVLTALAVFVRRAATHFFAERPSDGPLDGWRYPLLTRLADSSPQHAAQLARAFGLNQSTVGRHLAQLETAGLIQRTQSPQHGKRPVFAVTAVGHEALLHARRTRMGPLRARLETWPVADQRALLRLLENLNRDLGVRDAGWRLRRHARDGEHV